MENDVINWLSGTRDTLDSNSDKFDLTLCSVVADMPFKALVDCAKHKKYKPKKVGMSSGNPPTLDKA